MANEPQYLVEHDSDGPAFDHCTTVDEAIQYIRQLYEGGRQAVLWQRVPVTVTVDVEVGVAPKRKRKESPAPEQTKQTTPAAEGAPKAGENSIGAGEPNRATVAGSSDAPAGRTAAEPANAAGRPAAEGGSPTPAAAAKWGHTPGGEDWHLWYPDRGEAVCGSLTTAEITFEQPVEGETKVCFRCAKRAPKPAAAATPSCGGKACEVKGHLEVHRPDPSCSKFNPPKRGAAAK